MDQRSGNATHCCAECGISGGDSLKTCGSCMLVRYCNPTCQRSHWSTHKIECKRHAAELRDEALFKDPPAKEDCPICCLPMPIVLIFCVALPPATISSVPIYDFAVANQELACKPMDKSYPCCGKCICLGCAYSSCESGNDDRCPFCNSDRGSKTVEEEVEEILKRVEAKDAVSIYMRAGSYRSGLNGFQQDCVKAMELYTQAAKFGFLYAHYDLGGIYHDGGDLKMAKFHYETAAMAGHEVARFTLGCMEAQSGNMERSMKHSTIAASAGHCGAMRTLLNDFEKGNLSKDAIDSTLAAYNNSCIEIRSEPRDAYIRCMIEN